MAVVTQYAPTDDAPTYRVRGESRRVDRIVTGFGGARHAIFQPLGTPKPREECEPFSYTLHDPTKGYNAAYNVDMQGRFVKGLEKLSKPKRKARARKDGYSRHVDAFLKARLAKRA